MVTLDRNPMLYNLAAQSLLAMTTTMVSIVRTSLMMRESTPTNRLLCCQTAFL